MVEIKAHFQSLGLKFHLDWLFLGLFNWFTHRICKVYLYHCKETPLCTFHTSPMIFGSQPMGRRVSFKTRWKWEYRLVEWAHRRIWAALRLLCIIRKERKQRTGHNYLGRGYNRCCIGSAPRQASPSAESHPIRCPRQPLGKRTAPSIRVHTGQTLVWMEKEFIT